MSAHPHNSKNSVHCQDSKTPNRQGNRIFRKIRKSYDLHCFESSDEENSIPSSNYNFSGTKIKKTISNNKQKKSNEVKISTDVSTDENDVSCDNDKCFSTEKRSLSTRSVLKQSNHDTKVKKFILASPSFKESEKVMTHEGFTYENVPEETACNSVNEIFEKCMDNKFKKRRIVKAKRILNNEKHQPQQPEKEPVKETFENNKLAVEVKQIINIIDEDLSSINNTTEPSQRKKSTIELTVDTLPSPISPSQSNTEGDHSTSIHGQSLIFNSSREDIHPSKRGAVQLSSKRRTYELEDSVNDISLLKSASEQHSIRCSSSYKDYLPLPNETPTDANFSKITTRRRWNKVNTGSPLTRNYSPSWVNTLSKKKLIVKSPPKSEKKSPKSFKVHTPKLLDTSNTSSKKNYSSKVKMPNFAAIHQRALEKVESIIDYKQRKEERAMMLLSGKKPVATEQPRDSSKKEKRKQLRFAADTSFKKHSPTFIPLPSTPLPKLSVRETTESPENPKTFKCQLPKVISSVDLRSIGKNISSPASLKRQMVHKSKLEEVFLLTQKIMAEKKMKMKENSDNNKSNGRPADDLKTVKNVAKQKNIKTFATKSKPKTNTVESRRYTIKGVRSNRRFELLMNMRKGV